MAAFRDMPGEPIYSPRRGEFRGLGREITGLDMIVATSRLLGRDSEERLILLTWARSMANPFVGGTVAEFCHAKGLERSTFDRRRRRAATTVAAGINAFRLLQPSEEHAA